MATILVPLPRLVLSTRRPFFCRGEGAINEAFFDLDRAEGLQVADQSPQCTREPSAESDGGRSDRRIPLSQVFPASTGAQDPQDAVKHLARGSQGRPRPSGRRIGTGISGLRNVHCASVRSMPRSEHDSSSSSTLAAEAAFSDLSELDTLAHKAMSSPHIPTSKLECWPGHEYAQHGHTSRYPPARSIHAAPFSPGQSAWAR